LATGSRDRQRHHPATPASFEPSIDYVVTKIPRWAFEKLRGPTDGSVHACSRWRGDAIGARSRVLQKAIRSSSRAGSGSTPTARPLDALDDDELASRLAEATPERIFEIEAALRRGPASRAPRVTGVDPWFLARSPHQCERQASPRRSAGPGALERLGASSCAPPSGSASPTASSRTCSRATRRQCAAAASSSVSPHHEDGRHCAAEFEAYTPYHYATYEDTGESSHPGVNAS